MLTNPVLYCPTCRHALEIGEWPFCPHGVPHAGGPMVIDDQLEGGPRVFETMGHDAPYISSKSEWRREVAARNLEHVDRKDRAYFDRVFKRHDEELRDTGRNTEY